MFRFTHVLQLTVVAALSLTLIACGGGDSHDHDHGDGNGDGHDHADHSHAEGEEYVEIPEGGDGDAIMKAYISQIDKMTATVKQVTDVASAEKHGPTIQAQADHIQKISDQWGQLDQMAKASAAMKHAQTMGTAAQAYSNEWLRIAQNPEWVKAIGGSPDVGKLK